MTKRNAILSEIACLVLGLVTGASAQTYTVVKSFGGMANVAGAYPTAPLVHAPDETLYGVASGGAGIGGTLFKLKSDGTGFTVLKWFTNSLDGSTLYGRLILSGSTLYGTAYGGGTSNKGTVFEIGTNGSGFAVLKNFGNSDGANPWAGMVLSGSTLYGTTQNGGTSGCGTVFKLNTNGSGYTVVKNISCMASDGEGAFPLGGVVLSDNTLYGTTSSGTVFKVNTDGSGFTVLATFGDWTGSHASLVVSGSTLYGTAVGGASGHIGTIFKLNTDGSGYAVLKTTLVDSDLQDIFSDLVLSGNTLYGTAASGGSSGNGLVFKLNTDGSGYTVLENFTGAAGDGAYPQAGLALSGNTLYGTTYYGGAFGKGVVFKLNTDGSGCAVLSSFTDADSANPYAPFAPSGSTLYGTTYYGGGLNKGTVYKVEADGSSNAVLKAFTGADGANPQGGLILDGTTLYGTTYAGGISNKGTVFMLSVDGKAFAMLKEFTGSGGDGANPNAGLVLLNGVLYGTTVKGGSSGRGTVFAVNTDGSGYSVLYSFASSGDGVSPQASLVLSGNALFGTTYGGLTANKGTVFTINTDGSGYAILKSFTGAASDAGNPYGDLTISDSTLYGTTCNGGTSGKGTVFTLNTDGSGYAVLKSFTGSGGDGANPYAGLLLSGSTLYGTTCNGGTSNKGTAFALKTDASAYAVLKSFTGNSGDGANPYADLVSSGGVLYGTTYNGGAFGKGVGFGINLSPLVSVANAGNRVLLAWAAAAGLTYQLQYKNSMGQTNWSTLGSPITATNSIVNTYDLLGPDPRRFYRAVLQWPETIAAPSGILSH